MRVDTYFNLHKKQWSVRCREPGKYYMIVILHCSQVHLRRCEFIVNESGRQRVLEEEKKNVHAVVVGQLVDYHGVPTDSGEKMGVQPSSSDLQVLSKRFTYNPYKHSSFVDRDTGEPLDYKPEAVFKEKLATYR